MFRQPPLRHFLTIAALALMAAAAHAKDVSLLNVSYDPTREFYQDFNRAFAAHWKARTGDTVTVRQSHGGSGKQAGTVAQAYLEYLYSPQGQDIAGRNYYRPTDPFVAAKYARQHSKVNLFTIDQVFGGWAKAQQRHFADGGSFDRIYSRK